MSRFSIWALAFSGSMVVWVSGCASAYRGQACYAPPPPAVVAGTDEKPFAGSAYGFSQPGDAVAYYPSPPADYDFSRSQPYVPNYYGPFPREAARLRATQFYEPGPYYYAPGQSYTVNYYGYYSSAGYFRY